MSESIAPMPHMILSTKVKYHIYLDFPFFFLLKMINFISIEVEYFLRQSIRIKIPVSGKNIRNVLGMDGKGLEELKQKFEVCKI